MGAHVATIPPDIIEKMLSHPLTDDGLRIFAKDWEKVQKA
jgi:transaldolase